MSVTGRWSSSSAVSCSRIARTSPTVVAAVGGDRRQRAPVVVVHGGGKEIDAALKAAGIEKRQVDGLRITDEATLDVVVSVLAGAVNTRFVAALNAAGVAAVGLTGADAALRVVGGGAAAPGGGRARRRSRAGRRSRSAAPTCGFCRR